MQMLLNREKMKNLNNNKSIKHKTIALRELIQEREIKEAIARH